MNEKLYTLKLRQNYPLWMKLVFTRMRIKQWYEYFDGMVYVAFSGGKDSTVLLNIVRSMYPDVPAVFTDTGLEYPEIKEFVKTVDNVVWLKPKMTFKQVLDDYGFPVVSKEQAMAISRYRNTKDPVQKHRRLNGWPNGKKGMISKKWQFLIDAPFKISDACCDKLKKNPMVQYAKESGRNPMMGMMASESHMRKRKYGEHGCNAFDLKKPTSWPLSFWFDEDVWKYLKDHKVPYSKIYDMGETRTGCTFCMFGLQREATPNRFDRMKITHPKHYDACMNKYGLKEVIDFIEAGSTPAQTTMPFA